MLKNIYYIIGINNITIYKILIKILNETTILLIFII